MKPILLFCLALLLPVAACAARPGELTQIHEDFSSDPGWDGVNNRIECENCPTVVQDFGWSPTNHAGGKGGEIGGVVWRSTTPAWYAMPIGKPLSFKDSFSASGRLAVMPPKMGGAYFGFFSSERQGWRSWSSLGVSLGNRCQADYRTGTYKMGGCDSLVPLPADGSRHTWSLSYNGDAKPDLAWPDPKMSAWLEPAWRKEVDVLALANKDYPDITAERLRSLLEKARDQGLVENWMHKGVVPHWLRDPAAKDRKGRITFVLDGKATSMYMIPGHADDPTFINRFGIYNAQLYSDKTEFYLSDLTVNGHRVDLSKDPHWDGRYNRVSYTERDFHEKMDFGYSETNWAGESPGEIGGKFWSTEPEDPSHGYYGAEIGELTLEDRISFSGSVYFVDGGPDGQSFLGYFNKDEKMAPIEGEHNGHPLNQSMGIQIADSSSIGYRFSALCSPTFKLAGMADGPIFLPREKKRFTFDYDPSAGSGRITVTLEQEKFTMDLTPEMRKQGAKFDRFGLTNVRRGGKYNVIYYDDLTYTARRPAGYKPVKHEQKTVTIPYPEGGRDPRY